MIAASVGVHDDGRRCYVTVMCSDGEHFQATDKVVRRALSSAQTLRREIHSALVEHHIEEPADTSVACQLVRKAARDAVSHLLSAGYAPLLDVDAASYFLNAEQ